MVHWEKCWKRRIVCITSRVQNISLCLGYQIFPDVACHRKILDLEVKCSYVGCPWTGELRAVQVMYLRHIHRKGVLYHFIRS